MVVSPFTRTENSNFGPIKCLVKKAKFCWNINQDKDDDENAADDDDDDDDDEEKQKKIKEEKEDENDG